MKLFGRLFWSHLLASVVASACILIGVGLISPIFYNQHIDRLVGTSPENRVLRESLSQGHRRIMLLAFAASLPVALTLAAGTAYLEARRVVTAIKKLEEGGRALAGGHYDKRLELRGNDELAAIAQHFNALAESLATTEKERSALIATVAHELHTPLSALQGYTEAFAENLLPLETVTAALNRELEAMRRVTNDLLLVSRIEARGLELQLERCDSHALLVDACDRFLMLFEEKDIRLTLDALENLPPVYADYSRLLQVLSNLLSNALRYTPSGGRVVLGGRAHEETVRFWVSDSGPGIAAEHQKRIFDRFYRIDPARSRREDGSGIGLTVAKGLVEAMGGHIGLESGAGCGSTFFFTCTRFGATLS